MSSALRPPFPPRALPSGSWQLHAGAPGALSQVQALPLELLSGCILLPVTPLQCTCPLGWGAVPEPRAHMVNGLWESLPAPDWLARFSHSPLFLPVELEGGRARGGKDSEG